MLVILRKSIENYVHHSTRESLLIILLSFNDVGIIFESHSCIYYISHLYMFKIELIRGNTVEGLIYSEESECHVTFNFLRAYKTSLFQFCVS